MSKNYIESTDLLSNQNDEIFDEVLKQNGGSPFASISAECFYEIDTLRELRAYGTICRYSGKSGVCFTSNDQLKKDNPSHDDSHFSQACKKLHENGFLYRYQRSKHKSGSMRFLVPRCHWRKYHASLIRKNYYKEAARVEGYFEGVDPEIILDISIKLRDAKKAKKAKSAPPENRPLGQIGQPYLDLAKSANSNNINIINIRKKTNELKESKNLPESQPPKPPDSLRSSVPAALTDEEIFKELGKSGIVGEKAAIALEYWQIHKATIEKKNKPIGFLISASKQGWDADFVHNHKIKETAKSKQTTANETSGGRITPEYEKACFKMAHDMRIKLNSFLEKQDQRLREKIFSLANITTSTDQVSIKTYLGVRIISFREEGFRAKLKAQEKLLQTSIKMAKSALKEETA